MKTRVNARRLWVSSCVARVIAAGRPHFVDAGLRARPGHALSGLGFRGRRGLCIRCSMVRRGIYVDGAVRESIQSLIRRSVAQPGSASGLGPEGRRFESYRSDHEIKGLQDSVL